MSPMKRSKIFFLSMIVVFMGGLVHIDRIFFKRNSGFCVRFLYSCLPNNPEWDLTPPSPEEVDQLKQILGQKFHYLAKGCHCYAFISEDQQYVIKFHRYPSHMRLFPWLNHPFSYRFDERRKKIKEYNRQRLRSNLQSYKESYLHLKEETGLILLHINATENLYPMVTLVDKTQAQYRVPLDKVTFILQRKADLIYPTLDKLLRENRRDDAKKVISDVIHLITTCCQRGYVDKDPVLRKNYGLLSDRAIHIDVGDLIKNEAVKSKENYIPHVKEMTGNLRKRLEQNDAELLEHYDQEISSLKNRR
jgi:hypothetical protein